MNDMQPTLSSGVWNDHHANTKQIICTLVFLHFKKQFWSKESFIYTMNAFIFYPIQTNCRTKTLLYFLPKLSPSCFPENWKRNTLYKEPSNQGKWEGWGISCSGEMKNAYKTDHMEDIGIDERIISE